jgi:hypothetical protein
MSKLTRAFWTGVVWSLAVAVLLPLRVVSLFDPAGTPIDRL